MSAENAVLDDTRLQALGDFSKLCREADARGNLAADAYLAALAIESGCEWVSTDGELRALQRPQSGAGRSDAADVHGPDPEAEAAAMEGAGYANNDVGRRSPVFVVTPSHAQHTSTDNAPVALLDKRAGHWVMSGTLGGKVRPTMSTPRGCSSANTSSFTKSRVKKTRMACRPMKRSCSLAGCQGQ